MTKRILVVDDDFALLKSITYSLARQGYFAEGVSTLEDAKGKLIAQQYDLVITDYELTWGETGLEVLSFMKHIGARAPAIMISGATNQTVADSARLLGVHAFVLKPFEISAFIETCEDAMNVLSEVRGLPSQTHGSGRHEEAFTTPPRPLD